VRIGYARASTIRQSLDTALEEQRNGEWRYLEFLQVAKLNLGRHIYA